MSMKIGFALTLLNYAGKKILGSKQHSAHLFCVEIYFTDPTLKQNFCWTRSVLFVEKRSGKK